MSGPLSDENLRNLFKKGQKLMNNAQKEINKKLFIKARKNLIEAKDIFELTNSTLKEGQALYLLANVFEFTHDFENALLAFKDSLEKLEIAGSPKTIAKTNLKLTNQYIYTKNFDLAHVHSQKAIDLLEQQNLPLASAQACFLQGSIYFLESDLNSALFYYSFSKDYLKQQNDFELSLNLNENLGEIYQKLGKFKKSNSVLLKSLSMEQSKKNFTTIAAILKQIALNYSDLGKKNKSIAFIKDSIKIKEKLKDPNQKKSIVDFYKSHIKILMNFDEYDLAEDLCEKSIEIAENYKLYASLVDFLITMVKIAMLKYKKTDKNINLIKNYLKEAGEIAKKYNNLDGQISEIIQRIQFYKYSNKKNEILKTLKKGLDLAKLSNSEKSLGTILEQFGIHYYSQNNYQQAMKYFSNALIYFTNSNSIQDLAGINYNIACCASLLNFPEKTIKFLRTAVNFNAKFKKIAKTDKDFKAMWNEEIFINIVE